MRHDNGFTLIELLVVVAIITIIAAIAIPGLLRAYQSGNETSAIASMSAINNGQAAFAATCGEGFFVGALENLAKGPGGSQSAFISSDLATNDIVKSGYKLSLAGGTVAAATRAACNGVAVGSLFTGYVATATVNGNAGARNFGTNTHNVIYSWPAGNAPDLTENTSGTGIPIR